MFNFFDQSMNSTLEKVFSTKNLSKQAKLLDDYFLSQLTNFEENSLKKAVSIIHKSNHKYKVSDLAEAVCTTQKTLSRKFKMHLNCTIKEYIEIDQFRKSFNNYLTTEDKLKLGELAYKFNYYDQSGFIKQFTKITGINPKKLFKTVEQFGSEDLFWNRNV